MSGDEVGGATAGDPTWELTVHGDDELLGRVQSSLLSLGGGGVGTSGAPLLARGHAHRWLVAAGVYDGDGPDTHLLVGPVLDGVAVADADGTLQRTLDLRHGLLHERLGNGRDRTELVRFVSLARPGTVVARTRVPPGTGRPDGSLVVEDVPGVTVASGRTGGGAGRGGTSWCRVTGSAGGIVAAHRSCRRDDGVDDLVALAWDPDRAPGPEEAVARAEELARIGADALVEEHRRAWRARWATADVVVRGDDDLQRAVRFALFHLMASVPDAGEAAVGARGLTGTAYRGHVFWDADTFVLPVLAATHPPAARAMLEYRLRRLPAARRRARRDGRDGARFPWESARDGHDVTPTSVQDRTGAVVPIRTGDEEEHVVAQVAWAACQYADWTGDAAFAAGPGLELLVETARYWASRVRRDPDGTAHIDRVTGPDEYHESVDDSAFTNVMARWNLLRAAGAVEAAATAPRRGVGVRPGEPDRWRDVAAALVDGLDPATGVYEQFAGFDRLEPLVISEAAPRRPIAADLLLGFDRVRATQVVKQADVVMLHHQVPEAVAPGSLRANLDRYEPLTAHGSSLSPAVYASLFARLGDERRCLDALRLASHIDLDDLTGTTAGGLHLATMGGLWQALVYGVAGVRPAAGALCVDPWLPAAWEAIEVRVRYRGAPVRVRVGHDRLEVQVDGEVPLRVAGADLAGTGALRWRRHDDGWEAA